MTYQTPCSSPNNNPNDWFISRDGKQYPDDELLTEAEKNGISKSVLRIDGESMDEHGRRVEYAILAAAGNRRNAAKTARRRARDKCHTECYFRTACLGRALDEHQDHGTWGGYYEEELRELRKEITRRKKNKERSITTPE